MGTRRLKVGLGETNSSPPTTTYSVVGYCGGASHGGVPRFTTEILGSTKER